MPLYRYHCDSCGHTFRALEPAGSNLLRVCERCGKPSIRRTISRVGVVYRGSGFHSTDYRRNSRGKQAKAEQGPEGESAKTERD